MLKTCSPPVVPTALYAQHCDKDLIFILCNGNEVFESRHPKKGRTDHLEPTHKSSFPRNWFWDWLWISFSFLSKELKRKLTLRAWNNVVTFGGGVAQFQNSPPFELRHETTAWIGQKSFVLFNIKELLACLGPSTGNPFQKTTTIGHNPRLSYIVLEWTCRNRLRSAVHARPINKSYSNCVFCQATFMFKHPCNQSTVNSRELPLKTLLSEKNPPSSGSVIHFKSINCELRHIHVATDPAVRWAKSFKVTNQKCQILVQARKLTFCPVGTNIPDFIQVGCAVTKQLDGSSPTINANVFSSNFFRTQLDWFPHQKELNARLYRRDLIHVHFMDVFNLVDETWDRTIYLAYLIG